MKFIINASLETCGLGLGGFSSFFAHPAATTNAASNKSVLIDIPILHTPVIEDAVSDFDMRPKVRRPKLRIKGAELTISKAGVTPIGREASTADVVEERRPLPDIVGEIQRRTELTRPTIVDLLVKSNRLAEVEDNPQEFIDQASASLNSVLKQLLVRGIEYVKIDGACFEQRIFEEEEIETFVRRRIESKKSIFEEFEFDSDVERKFAEAMENRTDILMFFKLPSRFIVDTPLGTYNPDWAIVKQEDSGPKLYLVRETKGSVNPDDQRHSESAKNWCGKKHFEALDVDYDVAKNADDI